MKRKNYLRWSEAWDMLLRGEIISAIRLSDGGWSYMRRKAWSIGRQLVDSGIGVYRTYSLA
jgi:hypothetical protein